MTHISLEQIDRSGSLREMADEAGAYDPSGTRRDMLKKAGIAGAGFVAGGVLFDGLLSPTEAFAASTINWKTSYRSKKVSKKQLGNDVAIGNYALTLEYLEAAFYKEAAAGGAGILPDPFVLQFAQTVAAHEKAHVDALKSTLGKAAVKTPSFDFGQTTKDQTMFLNTANALEPVGTSAYAGAGPYVTTLAIVKAALSIHSVEARHAAWVATLLQRGNISQDLPAPKSFDVARSEKQVLSIVTKTGFIKS